MPGPRAVQNLQMPHPQDRQGGQMPRSRPGGGGLCAGRIDWCITSQQSEIKEFVLLHGILATVCDVPNFQLSELGQWRYWRKGSQTDQNFLVQTSFQWSSFLLRDKYFGKQPELSTNKIKFSSILCQGFFIKNLCTNSLIFIGYNQCKNKRTFRYFIKLKNCVQILNPNNFFKPYFLLKTSSIDQLLLTSVRKIVF